VSWSAIASAVRVGHLPLDLAIWAEGPDAARAWADLLFAARLDVLVLLPGTPAKFYEQVCAAIRLASNPDPAVRRGYRASDFDFLLNEDGTHLSLQFLHEMLHARFIRGSCRGSWALVNAAVPHVYPAPTIGELVEAAEWRQ